MKIAEGLEKIQGRKKMYKVKKKMKKLKQSKGITLIALVVTIIVLLILAGVSLNLVSGSDGILGRATNAVNKTNEAKVAEEVELAMAQLQMEYYQARYAEGSTSDSYAKYAKEQLESASGVKTTSGKLTLSGTTVSYVPDGESTATATGTFNTTTGEVSIAETTTGGGTPVATTYTLTYNAGDGTPSKASDSLQAGATINFATATRDGYRFLGWYDAATNGNKITYATMPASDTEIYAHWSPTIASLITSNTQYGMETNYQVTVNGVTLGDKKADVTDADESLDVWKVFYKDDVNGDVYLIYGDYLPAKCVPDAAKTAGLRGRYIELSDPIYNKWWKCWIYG